MPVLDLLTANDTLGKHPNSYYASNKTPELRPALESDVSADVCIIGAGFTGLSAALRLAQSGKSVIVLEASRIGFGASGRNGGQIGACYNQTQQKIEKLVGQTDAKRLFDISVRAHALSLDLCKTHGIDIGYKKGIAQTCFSHKEALQQHIDARYLQDEYGYDAIKCLNREDMYEHVRSPLYHGGTLNQKNGHGDPLAFAIGLAHAAEAAGAEIYEMSRVVSLDSIKTERGSVRANHIILACNGYLGDLDKDTACHVMPINNFIVTTEPLGEERACELMPYNTAVSDSKFVVNYFRRLEDDRLLFGGGESYGYRFPHDIVRKAQIPMCEIFPQLTDVKIDHSWGGTLAITMNRLPYVRRRGQLWVSAGYSGHGVALATFCGDMIGRAILNDDEDFATMARIPHRKFPGGPHMRHPLLIAAMLWYRMRDSIGH